MEYYLVSIHTPNTADWQDTAVIMMAADDASAQAEVARLQAEQDAKCSEDEIPCSVVLHTYGYDNPAAIRKEWGDLFNIVN